MFFDNIWIIEEDDCISDIILDGSTFLSKQEIEMGEKTSFGYDTKKQYIINVSKAGEECDKWIFGNIEIQRERGK